MLRHKIDLEKVYRERVKPELTQKEAEAMEKAMTAPPLRALYTNRAGKVYWYLLDVPPSLLGKHYGVADTPEETEKMVSQLLGPTATARRCLS